MCCLYKQIRTSERYTWLFFPFAIGPFQCFQTHFFSIFGEKLVPFFNRSGFITFCRYLSIKFDSIVVDRLKI